LSSKYEHLLINIADNDIKVGVKAMTSHTNAKKWFLLAVAATALLVIPRRSSRQANTRPLDEHNVSDEHNAKANHDDTNRAC
jgi:hypothetical protein